MNESWNLDRKPTAVERGTGTIAALLLCAAGAAALWFSIVVLGSAPAALLAGAFMVLFVFVLYRFIFGAGQKPQRSVIVRMAAVFTIAGIAALVGSFFAEELREKLSLLSLGLGGIGGGVLNFSRIKKAPSQPSQPTPASRRG